VGVIPSPPFSACSCSPGASRFDLPGLLVSVQIIDEQGLWADADLLKRLVRVVLTGEGYGRDCMVDVTLVTNRRMKELNHRHRRLGKVTDVLALPLQVIDPTLPRPAGSPNGPPLHLGDVVIAPDYVNSQAARHGWACSEEMALMVVHGVLHLLGYLHDSDSQAAVMEGRERRHLAEEGLKRR